MNQEGTNYMLHCNEKRVDLTGAAAQRRIPGSHIDGCAKYYSVDWDLLIRRDSQSSWKPY